MSKKVGLFLCPKGGGYANGIQNATLAKIDEAGEKLQNIGSSVENVPYVQKCIRYIMYTNQICIAPPKNSGARLLLLCSTVHNMFLLAKR